MTKVSNSCTCERTSITRIHTLAQCLPTADIEMILEDQIIILLKIVVF
jgi:hypothetical protein